VAYSIIEQKQRAALGRTESFTLDRPEDELRRRLLLSQQLPAAGPASFGRAFLPPVPKQPAGVSEGADLPEAAVLAPTLEAEARGVGWPNLGFDLFLWQLVPPPTAFLSVSDGEPLPVLGPPLPPEPEVEPLVIDLVDALQIGARNSRAYQQQKEQVFLAALALDLERDAFEFRFTPLIDATVRTELEGDDTTGVVLSPSLRLDKAFKTGALLTSRIGLDLAKLLSGDEQESLGIFADASVTIPLLRGAGVEVVTEPLQQSERDALYAIWQFERFKREFAVDVSRQYFDVLFARESIENSRAALQRLTVNVERTQRFFEEGRFPGIEVDQVRSNQLQAFSRLVLTEQRFEEQLDRFKLFLGLPVDAAIVLSDEPLSDLEGTVDRILGPELLGGEDVGEVLGRGEELVEDAVDPGEEQPVEITPTTVPEPTDSADLPALPGSGDPLEDQPESRATLDFESREVARRAIAFALANRLDLAVTFGRVVDAQRQTVVAADGLNGVFDVVADASAGGRRGAFSGAADDADLRFDRGSYGVGVNLELPAERTRERNVYRSSLINLDRAIRAAQEAEDRVKLDVISALRSLRVTAEDLRIQFESIRVARRRVAAANLRQELGQGQIREVTEAEDDLVQAQDDFTRAVVDFRIAELELRRDLGVLEVDSQGLYADGLSLPELMDGPARPGNPSDRP
jgi:outer membrane protein TolC